MKKINKTLIIGGVLACFIFNLTIADNSDCQFFENHVYSQKGASSNWFDIVNQIRETTDYPYTNFLTVEQQKAIITKDDLNTALLNLKKYCCSKEWWLAKTSETCEKDKAFFNDNVVDSKYLFDHIFDVVMRRLNWMTWDTNIYTKTNMTVDDRWYARRQRISNQAISIEWSSPQNFINKYKEFWQKSSSDLWYDISQNVSSKFMNQSLSNFLEYVKWWWGSSDTENVSNAMKRYNEWTLYDRYINACALSEYFYALLALTTEDKYNYNSRDLIIQKISNHSCDNVVSRQIIWENNYVSSVMQNSFNVFLSNYMEGYMNYLNERQFRSQSLFKNAKDRWLDVIRATSCLQSKCNA